MQLTYSSNSSNPYYLSFLIAENERAYMLQKPHTT